MAHLIDRNTVVAVQPRRLGKSSVGADAGADDDEVDRQLAAVGQYRSGDATILAQQPIKPNPFANVHPMRQMHGANGIGGFARRDAPKYAIGHLHQCNL